MYSQEIPPYSRDHLRQCNEEQYAVAAKRTLGLDPLPGETPPYNYIASPLWQVEQLLFQEQTGVIIPLICELWEQNHRQPIEILDLGGGTGKTARDIITALEKIEPEDRPQVHVTVITAADPRTPEEKDWDHAHNLDFEAVDINTRGLEPCEYDLIYSLWTLNHLVDPLRTIQDIYTALAAQGQAHVFFGTVDLPFRFFGSDAEQKEQRDAFHASLNNRSAVITMTAQTTHLQKQPGVDFLTLPGLKRRGPRRYTKQYQIYKFI